MDRPRESQETVGAALTTVIHAGQQLLADRVELALLEGREALGRAVIEGRAALGRAALGIALGVLGGIVLLGGVVILDIALVDRLQRGSSGPVALIYCAALHGAIGSALLLAGLWPRTPRRSRDESDRARGA